MMREALKAIEGQRKEFSARFCRSEMRTNKFATVKWLLFLDVKDGNQREVTDHIWFRDNQTFQKMHLEQGDVIRFLATAKAYWKGYYTDRQLDYKLARPGDVRRILQLPVEELPIFQPSCTSPAIAPTERLPSTSLIQADLTL